MTLLGDLLGDVGAAAPAKPKPKPKPKPKASPAAARDAITGAELRSALLWPTVAGLVAGWALRRSRRPR